MEIVETEQKYGRDLQIILEEFYQPMLCAGLLTLEQLSAVFLNVEELLEHNLVLAEKLRESVETARVSRNCVLYYCAIHGIFHLFKGIALPRESKNIYIFREFF